MRIFFLGGGGWLRNFRRGWGHIFSGGVGNILGGRVEIFWVGLGIIWEAGLTFFREGLRFFWEGLTFFRERLRFFQKGWVYIREGLRFFWGGEVEKFSRCMKFSGGLRNILGG